MRICPKCRTTYPSLNAEVCVRDGVQLVDHARFVEESKDPLIGKLVAGRYRIEARVGQGGMGTVYRASQAGLNRAVAVKILKQELNVDPDTVARFHREANAMSKLAQANSVRVYDFGQTDDGLFFIVMELLEGELLTDKIEREGAFGLLDAIRHTQQILRALAEAHSHGIVHRDLKPDNIFLAKLEGHSEPVVKVVDFGIAKVVAPDRRVDQFETQAGTVFGTPRYMSPEQAQGAPLDARSDLYSVGTLLYLMVTGRAPFVDDDAVVVMAKHIREEPEAPSDAAPDRTVPSRLEGVILQALAKDPEDRFVNAAAFERALDDCMDDVLLASGLPSREGRTTRFVLGPLVVVGFLGAVALAAWVWRAADERPGLGRVVPSEEAGTPVVEAPPIDAEGAQPQPAKVSLESEPSGATVLRDGEALGETPLDLWVPSDTEILRLEVRKEGYQPLVAEVSATEGERLLRLVEAPEPRSAGSEPTARSAPVRRPAVRRRKPVKHRRSKPKPKAEPKPVSGPYERFD